MEFSMAECIISYPNKLFQKNESKKYEIQSYGLDGLVLLIFKKLSELKQQRELEKISQKDTNNKLPLNDFEDSSTKE